MSKLASALPKPDEVNASRVKPGPKGACAVYGPGDQEDWLAVTALQAEHDWKTARAAVHTQLGITTSPPDLDRFRYHWRGKCGCWSSDLKEWIGAQA